MELSKSSRIRKELALAILHHKDVRGYLFYFLIKDFDNHYQKGQGYITKEVYKELMNSIGIERNKKSRGLKAATSLGLLYDQTKGDKSRYMLKGLGKVADELGVPEVTDWVYIPLPIMLDTKLFKEYMYKVVLQASHQRPISRKVIREITGISERTQSRIRKNTADGSIKTHRNFELTKINPDTEPERAKQALQEKPGFIMNLTDKSRPWGRSNKVVCHHLPNSYEVNDSVEVEKHHKTKSSDKLTQTADIASTGCSSVTGVQRIFCGKTDKAKSLYRKEFKKSVKSPSNRFIRMKRETDSGGIFWSSFVYDKPSKAKLN